MSKTDAKRVLESLRLIEHRGPDGEGVLFICSETGDKWSLSTKDTPGGVKTDGELNEFPDGKFDIVLGHRRLSIFDLSIAAHQPFIDKFGNAIIFNGEVYNFKEIKEELKKDGFLFHTTSDTEVILAAYVKWKDRMLEKFNGMFSLVIWDNSDKKIFAVNDRFGVKPLYYFENEQNKILCSEIKQFLCFDIDLNYDFNKVKIFLEFGLIDQDQGTFYKEINRFPNAHFSYVEINRHFTFHKYYSIEERRNHVDPLSFKSLFKDAVSIRLRADVPWGIGISGGLDSSIIVYTADKMRKENDHRIIGFSSIAPGFDEDESEFINYITNDLKIESKTVNSSDSFLIDDFIKHIWHQDAPVTSSSFFAQFQVARLAKNNGVKVLLGGQGADELFGGYHHHFYRYCSWQLKKLKLNELSMEVKSFSLMKGRQKKEVWKIITDEFKLGLLTKMKLKSSGNELIDVRSSCDFETLLKLDFTSIMLPYYLRSDDRTSMAHSIETRHPFLDYRIVDFAFNLDSDKKIHNGWQKNILRETFDYVPSKLRYRTDKKGFTSPREKIEKGLKESLKLNDDLLHFLQNEGLSAKFDTIKIQSLSLWMDLVSNYRSGYTNAEV